MAWAQEMKNLAADIRTSHRDRAARLSEIKDETKEIRKQGQQVLRDADTLRKSNGSANGKGGRRATLSKGSS